MENKINRRSFLKNSTFLGMSAIIGKDLFSAYPKGPWPQPADLPQISVVTGSDYLKASYKAVELLGGIKKFIPKKSKVAILPNTQSKHPGTHTSPEILKAIIRMCKDAGAKEIRSLSWLPQKFWDESGLGETLQTEGAALQIVGKEASFFQPVPVPKGKALKEAWIMKELYDCDVLIDLPISKDHVGNKFTGTMKNLMALNSPASNRTFHRQNWETDINDLHHLDQSIADLNTVIKPTLCIVDSTEFITTNGPFGPGKLLRPQKVVAGVDRIALDSYCANLLGLNPENIFMIKYGFEHGLGEMDLKKIAIKEVAI